MKKNLLAVPVLAGIALSTLAAAPAHAATGEKWPSTKPYIEYVGGAYTNPSFNETSDTRPEILVSWNEYEADGTLRVVDGAGNEVCAGGVSDTYWADGYFYACTPEADLPFGEIDLHAVIESPDGATATDASDDIPVTITIPKPTIYIDSYDKKTQTLHVSGQARSADSVEVFAGSLDDPESRALGTIDDHGDWSATLTGVTPEKQIIVKATKGTAESLEQEYLRDVFVPEAPVVDARTAGRVILLTVTAQTADEIYSVINQKGTLVAGGSGRLGKSTTFTLPNPGREAHYSVVTTVGSQNSKPTEVVLNAGLGKATPDAPRVEKPSIAGTRAAVSIHGEPGATVTVRDASGDTVASRMVGQTGSAQLSFTVPAARSGAEPYSVTQATSDAVSEASHFGL